MARAQKKLKAGWALLFTDESGYSGTPYVSATWAPACSTPVLRHTAGSWMNVRVISPPAVRIVRKRAMLALYFRMYMHPVHQDDVTGFLKAVAKHVHGHGVFVMDNAKIHKGGDVYDFFNGKKVRTRVHPGLLP